MPKLERLGFAVLYALFATAIGLILVSLLMDLLEVFLLIRPEDLQLLGSIGQVVIAVTLLIYLKLK